MLLELRRDLQNLFEPQFQGIMSLKGRIHRKVKGRETISTDINGKTFFVKKHFGIGWGEILKELFQCRLPVLGAQNEYVALQHLKNIGIDTLEIAGYGLQGKNPATQKSFIITDNLANTKSLNDLRLEWQNSPPSFALKKYLITKLASILKRMHESGLNHRDCYILHFRLDESILDTLPDEKPKLTVIDLHRAKLHRETPRRWVVKDLAGIVFSSMDINLTLRDKLRFIKTYHGLPLREILVTKSCFWRTIYNKGKRLYLKHQG